MNGIKFKSCKSYYIPPFDDIRIVKPVELEMLEKAYGVTVELRFEDLNDWFANDFFDKCQSLVPKAQSKFIIENQVKSALATHSFDFKFNFNDSEMHFQTQNKVNGWTENFSFVERGGEIVGEGTTKFYSSDAVVRQNGIVIAKKWAAFYVS
jgi:hypothetical protein